MSTTAGTPESVAAPPAVSTLPAPVPAPGPGGGGGGPPGAAKAPLFSAAAWSPLKVELFRSLYIATSIAQIGTWAREAASPSLMMLLTQGWHNQPDMVGRITLFSNLPICLFSIFAGALADVLDRRRLLIWTNVWMIVVSIILGCMTLAGAVTPWGLLFVTFLLGVGTAASGPALQAVLPELVPPKDMALAINLNSVALNVARAVGPATFILVVWVIPGTPTTGIGTSFLLSALTFAGAVWVLARWKRAPQRAAVHGEGVWGAIRSGFRYTIHSRANRAILFRVMAFIIPALVLWSQVPVIAQNQLGMPRTPASYALLFAFVGVGAIFGVLLMPGLHARYRIDPVVNGCIALFAAGLIVLAFVRHLWLAAPLLVFLGVNWVIIPTNFNTATQKSVPPWVKGRAISWYLTILFGSFAVGGALWGRVTTATNIGTSLLLGGASMAVLLLLAKRFPLTTNEGLDLSPAFKPGQKPDDAAATAPLLPAASSELESINGPVEVRVEYRTDAARHDAFIAATRRMRQHRLRNGASNWQLSALGGGRYAESFVFASRAELSRQTGRMTVADLTLHSELRGLHAGVVPPVIRAAPATSVRTSWLAARFDAACDRAVEELINGVARVRGTSGRAKHRDYI